MDWLSVMTLPDGTSVEVPMSALEDTGHDGAHGYYRVRGSEGVTEFATLPEVLDHLSTREAGTRRDPLIAAGAVDSSERRSRHSGEGKALQG